MTDLPAPIDLRVSSGISSASATATLCDLVAPQGRAFAPRASLRTGFSPLDDVLGGGLRQGELVLLGGKPGRGKTVTALQWARNAAANGHEVGYVCFEHDDISLLSRLLMMELAETASERACNDRLRLERLRQSIDSIMRGTADPVQVLASDPLLVEAERRVRTYGHRLQLIQGNSSTSVAAIDGFVDGLGDDVVVFVDYLQKVPSDRSTDSEGVSATRVAEQLKEMALRRHVPVVAIAAADRRGIAARRTHLHHLRGSTGLAYEADVVISLNDKLEIVARSHLAYDTTRVNEFRDRVVFSIEKNRSGLPDVHLEFRKDFAHFRFDAMGGWVNERLWDEGSGDE